MNIEFVQYDYRYLEKSNKWLSDPEIKYLTQSPEIDRKVQKEWFESLPDRTDYIILGVEVDRMPAGAVGIKHIINGEGEYWGYIGEKSLHGLGIGSFLVKKMISIARDKGMHRLYLHVIDNNYRAIKLYKKHGFQDVSYENHMIRMELEL